MSSVNNTNGPVDFWANLKKQKEEEARQKEQEARELAMPFDVQQTMTLWNQKWYRNRNRLIMLQNQL